MSWEVLLLRLPGHVTSMEGLPDDEDTPPLGPKPWVLDAVRRALPESDLTNPTRGQVEGPGWSIELILGSIDPVDSIMLQVRGNCDDALAPIFDLAAELGCRVVDVVPRLPHMRVTPGARNSGLSWEDKAVHGEAACI